ncbi:hypothetical protein EVB39_116 [Rhizobium phage RHph_TM3_3_9]|nr:hypothetical protein EVB39_116 [Rhizobium phage RHph_TM3_3_9]QIG67915.1 hypothetical protein EVB53_113 [Rhizobium phage RHph_Y60]QIG68637.1 hypothetical protein EVB66_116 [Rhizobium phage RHph_TM3_3_13]QIG74495.1 hypothetical protein EVC09_115 [Rhizobium phage RHph_TM3_3_10]QXV74609.1 hypothetical protein [Rhizobium phage RHEph19]
MKTSYRVRVTDKFYDRSIHGAIGVLIASGEFLEVVLDDKELARKVSAGNAPDYPLLFVPEELEPE